MLDRRKIVAVGLFVIMGFFMFTFANPGDEVNELTTPVEETVDEAVDPEATLPVINPVVQLAPALVPAIVDNAPTITVEPVLVKIVKGTDYDLTTGVVVTDDIDANLNLLVSMTSTLEEEVGSYLITYSVTDSGNNTVTNTRNLIILEQGEDEDNDGYTNQEELDAETDFDDEDSYPEYDKKPLITLSEENVLTMEKGDIIPNFIATATDEADGVLEVTITHNIDKDKVGTYQVVFTATDSLENEATKTINFEVVDTTKPLITIGDNGGHDETDLLNSYKDYITFSANEEISLYIINGNQYTDEDVLKTITNEGNTTIKVVDLSGNESDELTVNIYKVYTVDFLDYNNSLIDSQLIKTGKSYVAPTMSGYTANQGNVVYEFTNWDKSVGSVTSNLSIKASYKIKAAYLSVYEFVGTTRPLNGKYSGNPSDYLPLQSKTLMLNLNDEIINVISSSKTKIISLDSLNILNYIQNVALMPVVANGDDNFTKYEWYVLKFEKNDGFHLDGQVVVDQIALDLYRTDAINNINTYAQSFGFNLNDEAIVNILNIANINNLNTKTTINSAVTIAKNSLDALFSTAKSNAKNEIQNFINSNKLLNNYLLNANSLRDTAFNNIDNSTTLSQIASIVTELKTAITNMKNLSLITFNTGITTVSGDWEYKYMLLNNIASDVIITKVQFVYDYLIFDDVDTVYTSNSYNSTILVDYRLQNSDVVRVEYTKNGISYLAKFEVTRNFWGITGLKKYADTYVY